MGIEATAFAHFPLCFARVVTFKPTKTTKNKTHNGGRGGGLKSTQ